MTDVFPAFALGVGEGDRQVLQRPPRDPKRPIITPPLWGQIIGHALSITIATLAALIIAQTVYGLEEEQAVTVSFLTLAFAQLWHVFNMRDPRAGMFINAVTRNKFVWGALALCTAMIMAVIYFPFAAELLHLHRPDPSIWGLILTMSFAPVLVGQIGKEVAAFLYARRSRPK